MAPLAGNQPIQPLATPPQPFVPLDVKLTGPGSVGPGSQSPVLAAPAPFNTPQTPPLATPQTPQFTGTAPTPTAYGDFTAPNPADIANDPYYQFQQGEGQRGIEHAAAAKGTLLSGGLLKSLARFNQGLASEQSSKAFDRAMAAYQANRGTNAQNFGQQMDQFHGGLDAFGANTSAGLGYGRLGLDTAGFNADNAWRAANAQQGNEQDQNDYVAAQANRAQADAAAADYARSVAGARLPMGRKNPLPPWMQSNLQRNVQ
jgi:hypothetical protein